MRVLGDFQSLCIGSRKQKLNFFYFRVSLHRCQIHKDIPGFVIAFLEEDGELFEEDPEDVTEMILN